MSATGSITPRPGIYGERASATSAMDARRARAVAAPGAPRDANAHARAHPNPRPRSIRTHTYIRTHTNIRQPSQHRARVGALMQSRRPSTRKAHSMPRRALGRQADASATKASTRSVTPPEPRSFQACVTRRGPLHGPPLDPRHAVRAPWPRPAWGWGGAASA